MNGIERIVGRNIPEITLGKPSVQSAESSVDFKTILEKKLEISKHAAEQIEYRNIQGDENAVQRLEQALDMLGKKGVRQSLVMLDGTAFLMDVSQRKVITAMQASEMKEKVFTNIDGAIIA